LFEEVGVLLYEALPFSRDLGFDEDGRNGADRLAGRAINTCSRVYVHLFLFGASLYAIDGTHVNAIKLLRAEAGFANNICQNFSLPPVYLK
jgi:hypothetical protein